MICSFFVFVGKFTCWAVGFFERSSALGGMVLFLGECVDVDMGGM